MKRSRWVLFLGCVLAVPLSGYILPGVHVQSLGAALISGVVLGILWLLLRPLLRLLSLPMSFLTLGLAGFLADGLVVALSAWLSPGLRINNFWWGLLVVLVISVVRTVLSALFPPEENAW